MSRPETFAVATALDEGPARTPDFRPVMGKKNPGFRCDFIKIGSVLADQIAAMNLYKLLTESLRPLNILRTKFASAFLRLVIGNLILFTLLLSMPAQAVIAGAQTITLDGRLFSSPTSDTALLDTSVVINIKILAANSTCILYEEKQTVDTSQTDGRFTINVGSATGSGKRTGADTNNSMTAIFQNNAAISGSCGAYTPAAGDARYIRITIAPSATGTVEVLSPDTVVDSVPNALVAETLQGLDRDHVLAIDPTTTLSQTNVANIFSATNYPLLTSLLGGTSSSYVTSNTNGAKIPTVGGVPTSLATGQIWFNSSANAFQYYNGSAVQTLGISGSGISSLTVGASLTASGVAGGKINSSGTIDLVNSGVTAGTYPKVTVNSKGLVTYGSGLSQSDIPTLTTPGKVLGDAISSGTIGGSTAFYSSGNVTTTGNVSGTNITSITDTTRAIRLFDPAAGSMNKITILAPTLTTDYNFILPATAGSMGAVLTTDGSGNLSWTSASAGSVTSVGLALPSIFTVTNPLVTSTGNLTATLASQNANLIFAGPASGGAAVPSFRGLTAADLPVGGYDSSYLKPALALGQIWVGSSAGVATPITPTGDLTLSTSGLFTVTAIQGSAVDATAPTTVGQVLRWSAGSKWSPSYLSMQDIHSTVTVGNTIFPVTACTADKTLTWTSLTDTFTCQLIAIADSQVTYASRAAGLIFAGPATGSAAAPLFRAIASTDLPANAYDTTYFKQGGNSFGAIATLGTSDSNSVVIKTNNIARFTIGTDGRIGIGTSTPTSGALIEYYGVGTAQSALLLPRDSTANRPTGVAGMIRYNNVLNKLEVFENSAWVNYASSTSAASAGTTGAIQFSGGSGAFAADATNFFYDNTNQRLGIRTATPLYPLDVVGTGHVSGPMLSNLVIATSGESHFANSGYTDPVVSTAFDVKIGGTGNGLAVLGNSVFIKSVGIGTNLPGAVLDVYSTGTNSAMILPRSTLATRPTGVNGMIRYNTDANVVESFIGGTWSSLATAAVSGGYLPLAGGTMTGPILNSSGSAGAPSLSFSADSTSGFFTTGSGNISASTSGTTRLTIASTGNIGIGSTSPTQALDVVGNVKASGLISPSLTTATGTALAITTGAAATATSTGNALSITGGPGGTTLGVGGAVSISGGAGNNAYVGGALNLSGGTGSQNSGGVTTVKGGDGSGTSTGGALLMTGGTVLSGGAGSGGPVTVQGGTGFNNGDGGVVNITGGTAAGPTAHNGGNIVMTGGTQSSSGTPGYILMNSNVGIGSSVPIVPLNISGTSAGASLNLFSVDNAGSGNGTSANMLFRLGGATYGQIRSRYTSGGYLDFISTGSNPQMTLDPNGNLGVGTVTPAALLNLSSSGTNSALIVPRASTASRPTSVNGMIRYNTDNNALESYINGAWSNLTTAAAGSGYLPLTGGTLTGVVTHPLGSVATPSINFGDATSGLFATGSGNISLATYGTARITVLPSGYVGIGTANPNRALQVYSATGSSQALIQSGGANNANLTLDNVAGGNQSSLSFSDASVGKWQMGKQFDNSFFIYDVVNAKNFFLVSTGGQVQLGEAQQLNLQTSGAVGIGTSSATRALEIWGSGTGILRVGDTVGANTFDFYPSGTSTVLANNGTGSLRLWTNGQERLHVDATGWIGIGTGTPAAMLDVNGSGTSSAMLVPRDSTSTRPSGINGMLRYNTTLNAVETFASGAWSTFATSTGSTAAFINGGNSFAAAANLGTNDSNALNFKTNGTSRVTIDTSGNFGIGTTAPGGLFQSGATGTSGTIRQVYNGSSSYFGIYDSNNSIYYGIGVALPSPSGTATIAGYYKGLGIGGATNGGNNPIFGVLTSTQSGNGVGSSAMTVKDTNEIDTYYNVLDNGAGSMGIGTTSPGNKLDIWGTSNFGIMEVVGNGTAAESSIGFRSSNVSRSATAGMWALGSNMLGQSANSFGLYSGGSNTTVLTVTASGNVGIGTIAPTNTLSVQGTLPTQISVNSTSAAGSFIQFLTSGSSGGYLGYNTGVGSTGGFVIQNPAGTANTLVATNQGNVGIGTITPAQKLSVAGTIESTSGGVKFPDGTTQTSAAGGAIALRYYATTATSLPAGSFSGAITFNVQQYDTKSAFNGTTFTAPVAGIYNICASLIANTAPTNWEIDVFKNSARDHAFATSATAPEVTGCTMMQLAANDTLDVRSFQSNAVSTQSSSIWTWIAITKM